MSELLYKASPELSAFIQKHIFNAADLLGIGLTLVCLLYKKPSLNAMFIKTIQCKCLVPNPAICYSDFRAGLI